MDSHTNPRLLCQVPLVDIWIPAIPAKAVCHSNHRSLTYIISVWLIWTKLRFGRVDTMLSWLIEKKNLTVSLVHREMNQEVEDEVQYSYQAVWELVEALEDMEYVHLSPCNV